MINAGAIATAGLVGGATPAARLKRVLSALSAHAFRALEVERPALMIRLLHDLLLGLGQTAVRLTAEVAALET